MGTTADNIIKAFWMKYSFDGTKIAEAINKGEVIDLKDYTEKIDFFDASHECITCADERAFKYFKRAFTMPPMDGDDLASTIPLISWSKSYENFEKVLENYDNNIFVLSDAPEKICLPKDPNFHLFWMTTQNNGVVSDYYLYDDQGRKVYSASFFNLVFDLVKVTCKHLLVFSKRLLPGPGLYTRHALTGVQNEIVDFYISRQNYIDSAKGPSASRVKLMAVPGYKGCLANQLLKEEYEHFRFVDEWSDIEQLIKE